MKRSTFSVVVMFLALGCSASENHSATYFANKGVADKSDSMTTEGQDAVTLGPRPPAAVVGKLSGSKSVPRKIIYTAGVDLLVSDVAEASTKLSGMVQQFHGLVAQSEIKSDRGAPRAADWRVRVPVERFDDFIHQVVRLGEPTKNRTDSDDITDKFFDFQVRIANKKVQVERLQKIIKEQTGKVSELLEAERELGRVTTELEELEYAQALGKPDLARDREYHAARTLAVYPARVADVCRQRFADIQRLGRFSGQLSAKRRPRFRRLCPLGSSGGPVCRSLLVLAAADQGPRPMSSSRRVCVFRNFRELFAISDFRFDSIVWAVYD